MKTGFLYARCVARINGEPFYQDMKSGNYYYKVLRYEFEPILYVTQKAWGQQMKGKRRRSPWEPVVKRSEQWILKTWRLYALYIKKTEVRKRK